MKVFSILASCLAVFAIASCGGNDNTDNNNNNNNDTVQYTLTLNAGAHGTLTASPAGPKYDTGTVVTLTATPAAGFKVAAWTGSDSDTSTSPTNHITMSADKTVGVTFTAVSAETFTLTITSNANGTVTANPVGPTYNDGTTLTLTAAPSVGYEVDTWSGTDNDASTALINSVTMTANKTVGATFKVQPPQKTLTVTIDENGQSSAGGWGFKYSPPTPAVTHTATNGLTFTKTFDEGTEVTLTGISTGAWPVQWWTVDGGSQQLQCAITITMNDDHAAVVRIPFSSTNADDVCP